MREVITPVSGQHKLRCSSLVPLANSRLLCGYADGYPRSYTALHRAGVSSASPCAVVGSSLDTYRVIQKRNAAVSSPNDRVVDYLLSKANTPVVNRRSPRPKIFPTGGKLIKRVCKELTEFGTPLKKIPAQFADDVRKFINYLSDTDKVFFKITNKYIFKSGEEKVDTRIVPYIHRWTDIYRKSILSKLYQLEKALTPAQLEDVTMITLTVSQRGKDQEEALYSLMENYRKLMDVLRHRFKGIDYFYVLEPHVTGYAHMHLIYLKKLSLLDKQWILSTWDNRYGAGSYKGMDFSEPRVSADGSFGGGKISKLRSYVMKYLSKGLRSEHMENNELLFNALLKKTGIRLWNCSRRFSRIMRAPKKSHDELLSSFECLKVELWDKGYAGEDGFVSQIYPKPKLVTCNVYNEAFLYSVSVDMFDSPVLARIKSLVELGIYSLKRVGEFYHIYERVHV